MEIFLINPARLLNVYSFKNLSHDPFFANDQLDALF